MSEASRLIRNARRRGGVTQAQLARNAGTSQPVVSAYEHGKRDPSVETLRRLVAAAGSELRIAVVAPRGELPPPRTEAEHAARLLDVLSLADAIPRRSVAATMDAPPLVSR